MRRRPKRMCCRQTQSGKSQQLKFVKRPTEYPEIGANPPECNAPAVGDSKRQNEYRRRHEFDGPPRDRLQKFGLTVSPTQLVRHMERIHEVRWPRPMNSDPKVQETTLYEGTHNTVRPTKRALTDVARNSQKTTPKDEWGRAESHSLHSGVACGGERREGGPTRTHITASTPKDEEPTIATASTFCCTMTLWWSPRMWAIAPSDIGRQVSADIVFSALERWESILRNPSNSVGSMGMRERKGRIILPATVKFPTKPGGRSEGDQSTPDLLHQRGRKTNSHRGAVAHIDKMDALKMEGVLDPDHPVARQRWNQMDPEVRPLNSIPKRPP
ncbi:hypothetical protein FNV43_RR03289 [Rhamnella rubrinervis]|uniref:Uncharacterized protein n=1 Tax=Rhamnella rubrinervis TaxID=2594499 RepID=A0A8K0MNJ7_9ROSA|nr:hypothetical protein FNV43_RR03289 [Rhamnella rubrinervis]